MSETEKMNLLAINADGCAVYKPVMPTRTQATAEPYEPDVPLYQQQQVHSVSVSVSVSGMVEPVKRKRGRPRKCTPDGTNGSSVSVKLASPQLVPAVPSSLKTRGRPPGSTTHKHTAFGSAGIGFTPHVILVQAGEGRFEILSLSGSILLSDDGGHRSRTGGLSVSLAGPDGHVLGGGVAGLLTAASPVQIIIGSFMAEGWKDSKSGMQAEPLSSMSKFIPGTSAVGSTPSMGNLSESSGGPGSPLNYSTGGCSNSNPPSIPNIWN